jgi:hypothetical protein
VPLKSLRQMRYLYVAETGKKKLARLPEVVQRKRPDARRVDPLVKARRAGKTK